MPSSNSSAQTLSIATEAVKIFHTFGNSESGPERIRLNDLAVGNHQLARCQFGRKSLEMAGTT